MCQCNVNHESRLIKPDVRGRVVPKGLPPNKSTYRRPSLIRSALSGGGWTFSTNKADDFFVSELPSKRNRWRTVALVGLQCLLVAGAAATFPLVIPYLPDDWVTVYERVSAPKMMVGIALVLWLLTSSLFYLVELSSWRKNESALEGGHSDIFSVWKREDIYLDKELFDEDVPDISKLMNHDLGHDLETRGSVITRMPAGKWVKENNKDWKIVERRRKRLDMQFCFPKLEEQTQQQVNVEDEEEEEDDVVDMHIPCLDNMTMEVDERGRLTIKTDYLDTRRKQWIKRYNDNLCLVYECCKDKVDNKDKEDNTVQKNKDKICLTNRRYVCRHPVLLICLVLVAQAGAVSYILHKKSLLPPQLEEVWQSVDVVTAKAYHQWLNMWGQWMASLKGFLGRSHP